MRMKCSDVWEGITELALGNESMDAQQHVNACASCRRALDELRKVVGAMNLGWHDAPQRAIDLAISVGPPVIKRLPMIRSSLLSQGARRTHPDRFQRVFDAGDFEVRVMYTKTRDGWSVMIDADKQSVPSPNFGQAVKDHDGNHEFVAETLERTGFSVYVGMEAVAVPPASEALEHGELP